MRIFLVQTAKGLFSSSGAYKANICLLRHLTSRGHCVRQICYTYRDETDTYVRAITNGGGGKPQLRRTMLHLRAAPDVAGTDVRVDEFVMDDGVEVVALACEEFESAFGGKEKTSLELARETAEYLESGILSARLSDLVSFLQREIRRFSPTHIITSDGLSMKVSSAMELPGVDMCRIAVVHSAEQLPCGPFAGGVPGHSISPSELALLRQLDGIWSVSNTIKEYATKHGELQTSFLVHHPWTYLEEKNHEMPVHLHNWDKNFVGMINPCVVKGSQIFIGLAKKCPQLDFLAYKSWGFDTEIGKQMEDVKNITIRPSCADLADAWRDIKVLLVPSIWMEAWGIVLIEAHLRGIPVIASNAGALPEAMLGLDYLVPVNAIDGKRDEHGTYVAPEQDLAPWANVLNELMNDRIKYEKLSTKVRETTARWLESLDETALEQWMMGLAVKLK